MKFILKFFSYYPVGEYTKVVWLFQIQLLHKSHFSINGFP